MLRRASRGSVPRRAAWHGLQNFAVADADGAAMRETRLADAQVAVVVGKAKPAEPIDWASWKKQIAHKDVVDALHSFHETQTAILDDVLKSDHKAAVAANTAGWELFDSAVASCEKSVQASEKILGNGARALFISYNNPPINQVTMTEWIDADQYWAAFAEKHHYYHSHMNFNLEDPESKEYDAKQNSEIVTKWKRFDGKGQTRYNNKMLYQRPSFEYYDVFRGVFVEHMMFYLTKTGGDAKFFPETMPHQWFAEIYDNKHNMLQVLQRRKRIEHETSMSRVVHHEFLPHDMEHGADAYYAAMIAKETALVELQVGRLMGNFMFLSEAVPIQTESGLLKALALDGGKGTFYSLGSDVHCIFYKPASGAASSPATAVNSLIDHLAIKGMKLNPAYAEGLTVFYNLLETRKPGLQGAWFELPGESQADAFMRRLKKSDPAYKIYAAYVEEMKEKWASAEVVPADKVDAMLAAIKPKYELECSEFTTLAMSVCEELVAQSKSDDTVAKLVEAGEMQGLLDAGAYVAVGADGSALSAEALAAKMASFEDEASKSAEAVLGRKAAYDKAVA
jgi:hypothetical protein